MIPVNKYIHPFRYRLSLLLPPSRSRGLRSSGAFDRSNSNTNSTISSNSSNTSNNHNSDNHTNSTSNSNTSNNSDNSNHDNNGRVKT